MYNYITKQGPPVEKPVDSVDNFSEGEPATADFFRLSSYPQYTGYAQGVIHRCG
jgi:hypothetical protein